MTVSDRIQTNSITLTEAAAERVRKLLEERSLTGNALRIFVSGSGCSGLQYGMALEAQPGETDERFAFGDVNVVVDPVSITYLTGSKVDFIDDPMGGSFRIENPNASAGCGCGQAAGNSGEGESTCGSAGCGCQ
jgi:iron-sulfur cluster assembly protein